MAAYEPKVEETIGACLGERSFGADGLRKIYHTFCLRVGNISLPDQMLNLLRSAWAGTNGQWPPMEFDRWWGSANGRR